MFIKYTTCLPSYCKWWEWQWFCCYKAWICVLLAFDKSFPTTHPLIKTPNIFSFCNTIFYMSQGGLDYSAVIQSSKFQCLKMTKVYSCLHYWAILNWLAAHVPWCPSLGTQADGGATIWNIASYCWRGRDSPRQSPSAMKFSVPEVTHYTSTHDSLARTGLMPQSYHKQIGAHNPKAGLEHKETSLLKSCNDYHRAQRSVPDGECLYGLWRIFLNKTKELKPSLKLLINLTTL